MRSGAEVNIGLVKGSGVKEIKHGGGKMSSHHKKAHTTFLQLTQSEGKKIDASFMKSVDGFFIGCGGSS